MLERKIFEASILLFSHGVYVAFMSRFAASGLIGLCENSIRQLVACRHLETQEFYFLVDAYGAPGDSGGPVYRVMTIVIDSLKGQYAVVYGITAFYPQDATCIYDRLGVQLCRPIAASILYNVTADLRITPYSG